ncbi:hypothetical protein XENTR_v10021121 [Xenopus tropicalis]|nr:hypothetical protein XENTR_v10021121 [Xenopus tropicalis]
MKKVPGVPIRALIGYLIARIWTGTLQKILFGIILVFYASKTCFQVRNSKMGKTLRPLRATSKGLGNNMLPMSHWFVC